MKTPVIINNVEIRAIVDTGAATCAISKRLLNETGYKINRSSTMICITVDGTKTASLGKATIEIEIDEIITEIDVEVINSNDRTLIIGNDFLKDWRANIDFETHTLTLLKQGYKVYIPIEYIKYNKVKFEDDIQEIDEEREITDDEIDETPTYTIRDLINEYDSEEEELK